MSLGVLFNTDRLDHQGLRTYAQRVESLGYESLWLPELFTRDPFSTAAFLLAHTSSLKLATGIANIYGRDPVATVTAASTLQEFSDGRFLLGLGVSNAGLNQARGHQWSPPVPRLSNYLERMSQVKMTTTQCPFPVYVAAHGPQMLRLAGTRSDGANTYLMPLAHAKQARSALDDKTLNTMLFCLAEPDPTVARQTARKAVAYYMGLDYYHRAWRGLGYTDSDFADGGSDRLIDDLFAWGTMEQIRARIQAQYAAGASRVIVIPAGAGLGGQPDWNLLEALGN